MKLLIIEQPTLDECFDKVVEEYNELRTEHFLSKSIDDVFAEGMDLMQATYSYLLKVAEYDLDKLDEANKKHIAKLLGRGHVVTGGVGIAGMKNDYHKQPIFKAYMPTLCPSCKAELSEDLGDGYYKDLTHIKVCACGQQLKWESEVEDDE